MNRSDYEKLFLINNDGVFTPIYTCEEETPIYDEKEKIIDWELVGYVETMTAEEHYQKWLTDKENPPAIEPTTEEKMEVLQTQLDELSEYALLLEMKNIELEEQTTLNSEYVLDLDTRLLMLETK